MATGVATSFMFLLVLLLPLIAGIALIVMSRRKGKGYPACGKCGYDVSGTLGTTAARCPECGSDFAVVGITPPTTQVRRWPLVVGISLLLFFITCVGGTMLARMSHSRATQAVQAAQAARAAAAASTQSAANAAANAAIRPDAGEMGDEFPTAIPDEVRVTLESPLAETEINAMSVAEIQLALARVSKARVYTKDSVMQERLKHEFKLMMDRLRVLKTSTSPQ